MQTTDRFADAYAAYWGAASGFARSLTRDHHAAEDLAAEGLLRIWSRWEAGAIDQPWGYVRRTIVNGTIDRARRTAREEAALQRAAVQAPEPTTPTGGHDDLLADRDLVERLLGSLPPAQRQLLELRFLEDLSEREVAERLGISVGTVKSGTSRALARLRSRRDLDVALAA
jgi:RNA polymerase sigma factor (sigma-70 family)